MKVNIAELIKTDSKRIPLEGECSGFDAADDYTVLTPVHYNGFMWYENGAINFNIAIDYAVRAVCARCMEPFETKIHLDVSDEWPREDVVQEFGNEMDISELIKDQIILNVPLRVLCKENCNGLCSVCGCNLNYQTCDCMTEQYSNSQFAALKDWQSKSGKE